MRFFNKSSSKEVQEKGTPSTATPAGTPPRAVSPTREAAAVQPQGKIPAIAVILGATASIGGFMFGYESGQISGFLAMPDFLERFGENGQFSAIRQGTIVGLLAYVSSQPLHVVMSNTPQYRYPFRMFVLGTPCRHLRSSSHYLRFCLLLHHRCDYRDH
jgi:hypothetical protein